MVLSDVVVTGITSPFAVTVRFDNAAPCPAVPMPRRKQELKFMILNQLLNILPRQLDVRLRVLSAAFRPWHSAMLPDHRSQKLPGNQTPLGALHHSCGGAGSRCRPIRLPIGWGMTCKLES